MSRLIRQAQSLQQARHDNIKPVIAVDIDEVLVPFAEGFIGFYNQVNGTAYELATTQVYRLEEITGDTKEYMLEMVHQYHALVERRADLPIEGAVDAINRLLMYYEVDIVTSRRYVELEFTHKWLRQNFPKVFRKVHFIRGPDDGNVMTKSEICQQIGAKVLIEDQLTYALDAAKSGIRVLLFGSYPWNQIDVLPHNVKRVYNWDEVLQDLIGLKNSETTVG